jgi:hypothetical protein
MPDASTQLTEQQIELFKNLIDFGKIAVPSLITLIAVVLGARVGYRFSLRRFKLEKRLEFINQQVTEFYSPLVGCRMRIRASSELRVELSAGCNTAWRKICDEQHTPFLDHEKYFEPFKKQIEDENQRFPKYLLPLYDQMVDVFTKKYWLAEDSTKDFYKQFCRYVELWHRYYDDVIPPRVLEEVKLEEKDLLPFYEDLERNLKSLREELALRE